MHSALICLNLTYGPGSQTWHSVLADINALRQDPVDPLDKQKGVQRLAENVWLVNFP